MAHFYGTISGQRGRASRLGSARSGLRTVAASWQGSVHVDLRAVGGKDYAVVTLEPWHGAGTSRVLYDGPVDGSGAASNGSNGDSTVDLVRDLLREVDDCWVGQDAAVARDLRDRARALGLLAEEPTP